MDYSKMADEVIAKSKTNEPVCPVCFGKMMISEFLACDKAVWVCSQVKPLAYRSDSRVFDPSHYERSKVTSPTLVDLTLLRSNLISAFAQIVEAPIGESIILAHNDPLIITDSAP